MSHTLRQIIELVEGGEVRFSEHGYDEMAEEGIFTRDIVNGIRKAELLEDYPNFPKGPCVLVMQKDRNGCRGAIKLSGRALNFPKLTFLFYQFKAVKRALCAIC